MVERFDQLLADGELATDTTISMDDDTDDSAAT